MFHVCTFLTGKSILFGSNSLKVSALHDHDMKSGKSCAIVCQQLPENVSIV